MRTALSVMIVTLAFGLTLCPSGAFGGIMNPEDFESYTLTSGTYDLKTTDGWSSDVAGTTHPTATAHDVITGQELKMDNGTEASNIMYWQQPVFTDELQTLKYDVKITDVRSGTSKERSLFSPEALSTAFLIKVGGAAGDDTIGFYVHGLGYETLGASSHDTWYSIEVEFDSGAAQTVKARYKERGAGSWNSWSSTRAMQADPDGRVFRLLSNDVAYYDNISLTVVPEPTTLVLLFSGAALGLLVLRRRRRR